MKQTSRKQIPMKRTPYRQWMIWAATLGLGLLAGCGGGEGTGEPAEEPRPEAAPVGSAERPVPMAQIGS